MTKYVAAVYSGKHGFGPKMISLKYVEFVSNTPNIRAIHMNRNQATHLDSVEVISILRRDKPRYMKMYILDLDTLADVTELFQVYAE